MKYRFIDSHRAEYTVSQMCETLSVSRSAYSAWRHRKPSHQAERRRELATHIQEVHAKTYQIYGSRRVHAQLSQQGVKRVQSIARQR